MENKILPFSLEELTNMTYSFYLNDILSFSLNGMHLMKWKKLKSYERIPTIACIKLEKNMFLYEIFLSEKETNKWIFRRMNLYNGCYQYYSFKNNCFYMVNNNMVNNNADMTDFISALEILKSLTKDE